MVRDWDLRADELASEAIAGGDPTGWFDRLYGAGAAGEVSMPWDRTEPHPALRRWAETHDLRGDGRRAVVVGSGLGADAEYLSRLDFDVVGFDIAQTAVRLARERNPSTSVDYRVADLLDLPAQLHRAFDLVVDIFTVQALPDPPRTRAIGGVTSLVAPGGILLVVAFRHTAGVDPEHGPPFALTREVMQTLTADGLTQVDLDELDGPLWRGEYHRER